MAQLDRALASGAEDREFESPRARQTSIRDGEMVLIPFFAPGCVRPGGCLHSAFSARHRHVAGHWYRTVVAVCGTDMLQLLAGRAATACCRTAPVQALPCLLIFVRGCPAVQDFVQSANMDKQSRIPYMMLNMKHIVADIRDFHRTPAERQGTHGSVVWHSACAAF